MVLMKKTTQHLRHTNKEFEGSLPSVNPNTRSTGTGAATISINPARHISKANGGHNVWVATISNNLNTRYTGAATISINPARHTSKQG